MSTATRPPRNPCNHTQTAQAVDVLADWRDLALCAGLDMNPAEDSVEETEALEVCEACPVLEECNRWVMPLNEYSDPGGVCGGLTERRRRTIRLGTAIRNGAAARRAAS